MKRRVLISVFKKDGIVNFASTLSSKYGYEIVSTGGTARLLKENGINVIEVSELTKYPEMLDGRVKTLHPVVHGGILARRDKNDHMQAIKNMDIFPIDMVVINLYPFEEVIKNPSVDIENAIENIDIGGPSMIRSASKNFQSVTVVCDVSDLDKVLDSLEKNNGSTTLELRKELAVKAFARTGEYDKTISRFLNSELLKNGELFNGHNNVFPKMINYNLKLKNVLRYGENPHQSAALYLPEDSVNGLANAEVIQGKELSFNNYLDLDSALSIVSEFDIKDSAVAIVKHNNPCGVAISTDITKAYNEALSCDPVSAFGGIVALNQNVDKNIANELVKIFLEAIIAPSYDSDALEILSSKKNVRVLKVKPTKSRKEQFDFKRINEGYLVQDYNAETIYDDRIKIVTKRKPTEQEMSDLIFGWKVCKHVKSNAIVIVKDKKTVGIGAGQSNRVGSVEIALNQANYNSKGAIIASDAFFPFKDSIEMAASARISAIIQPGGSIRDSEVIEACDKYDIAMVFTEIRHFRH